MRTIALYSLLSACILGLLVLFSTQAYPQLKDKTLHSFSRPQPTPSPQPEIVRPPPTQPKGHPESHAYTPPAQEQWTFNYKKDARNYGLSEEQCLTAFPQLYKEIDRAASHRRKIGKNITLSNVSEGWWGDGIVRVMIRDNQLYIIEAWGILDRRHRFRIVGTLNSLNRAVMAYQGRLPDVEFTFSVLDSAIMEEDGNRTILGYSRRKDQETVWLMPDFGFWGWPSVGLNSYAEHQAVLEDEEEDFLDKVPKLVWRGALSVAAGDLRRELLKKSEGQSWSDVREIVWKNETSVKENLISMQDHCDYMFVAQTEGNTNSGRLKYILNCQSIVMSHELNWIEHFHHLLKPTGKDQNYVKLKRDFSDLPKTITRLLDPSTLESTGRFIVDNARRTFRERYLTPAAEACYWRALIRGYASVQDFEPQRWIETEVEDWHPGSEGKKVKRKPRGVPFEAYAVMEATEWQIPAKGRHLCIDEPEAE